MKHDELIERQGRLKEIRELANWFQAHPSPMAITLPEIIAFLDKRIEAILVGVVTKEAAADATPSASESV